MLNREALLLTALCAVMTATANLLMRHGLLSAGGISLTGDSHLTTALNIVKQVPFDIGFILYGLAAIVWFRVLSIAQVSSSYPILVALTFVLVSVGAMFFFKDTFTTQKALSILLILIGIIGVATA